MIKIGSHVSMNGSMMMVNSVKEALSYDANTFMLYTGAPQNTRRKPIEELHIAEAWQLMRENGIEEFYVHAPYIINLANSVKQETFDIGVEFLQKELERTEAMGSGILILHPGSHVGEGEDAGIAQTIKGLNMVLEQPGKCCIALETMSGKGSEIGSTFEQLARIYDGVTHSERLRICFDTCHTHDSGYDIVNDFDGVMDRLDRLMGKDQIAVFHINDSKNPRGAKKDRHANIGQGEIGFAAIRSIVHHPDFLHVAKILETPYLALPGETKKTVAPYREEIRMLRREQG